MPSRDSAIWQDWTSFLRAYKVVVERIAEDMARAGQPTLVEYSVLFWLSNTENQRLRQIDLSRGVLVSKSRVTRLLNGMVESGYVRREKSLIDRRVTYAVMTEHGREVFEAATPVFARSFNRHFASKIDPLDHGQLARVLANLIEDSDYSLID